MKELLSKGFWRDVKQTFDQAREGSPPTAPAVPAGVVKPDAILFDMDGVLYNADRPIAGAAEAVA